MFEGPAKARISRQAVSKIASDLVQFGEGQSKPVKLPSERELAERFLVSRRVIRLAVELLERKNLVMRKHGSGNYVLPKKFSLNSAYLIIPGDLKAEDPFYSSLIGQMMLYSREHQIQLIPIRLGGDLLLNKEVPGVLLGKIPQEGVRDLTRRLATVVALTDLSCEGCCQVIYDDFAIGQEAARQLAEHGHRRVLVLAGPQMSYASARQRVEGFRSEASRAGVGFLVQEGKMNWRSGYELMKSYLTLPQAAGSVSAVFAGNDWMAAGAMQAILASGLRVPEDISVIGCDDVPLAAELVPPLATFRLDVGTLVEQTFLALEQVWRLALPKKIVLPAKFVKRESLGERQAGGQIEKE